MYGMKDEILIYLNNLLRRNADKSCSSYMIMQAIKINPENKLHATSGDFHKALIELINEGLIEMLIPDPSDADPSMKFKLTEKGKRKVL